MENNDNSYLFDLIQGIQSKLNEEKPTNSKNDTINMDYIQETMFESEQKKVNNEDSKDNFNFSDILNSLNLNEQIKENKKDNSGNFNLSDMINNFNFGEQKKEIKKDNNSKNNFNLSDILNNFNLSSLLGGGDSGFDVNTMMKIQKILSAMGKEDPRKNLLISLKPFLRKSRQDKINEYLTYLTIGNALGLFDGKGSDNDVT